MADAQSRLITRLATGALRRAMRFLVYGSLGAVVTLVTLFVVMLERRPDLEIWHTTHLDTEFERGNAVESFDDYRALEDRLFAQLEEEIYGRHASDHQGMVNRYRRGSLADPSRWPKNWNRSFELAAADPRAGVLLLHGMSDSPYSVRTLAQTLQQHGATAVGLRIPGHGTAPSGLLRVEWEDMAESVELAMRHLRQVTGDQPLYIVGYSNGGALAVHYALSSLQDEMLPVADGLFLMSPEIGITRLAALAAWQERLGRVLGLRKLSWNSINVEYDPFKYTSFALNAGRQAYRLTREIQRRMTVLARTGDLQQFPRVLAFQSAVDATVSVRALIQGLFKRLPPDGHELVIIDVNRLAVVQELLKDDPKVAIEGLFAEHDLPFTLSVITNENETSPKVMIRRRKVGEAEISESPLGLAWPCTLYSLSHIALPFPPDDPVYGGMDTVKSPGIQIGTLVARGERGVLQISPTQMLRVHWNPFHAYMERRMLEFMGLAPAAG
ncbi:MAG: alpha/beta fold hydrolase [Acidobacteria bacterium]|nr:MAG: alpha/beta fold hydrolase [Acidobacteriota bacterium]